jgi:hypothetical protein
MFIVEYFIQKWYDNYNYLYIYCKGEDRMKQKKRIISILLGLSCFLFTGCGDKLYSMTDKEQQQIISYSAAVVAKYNKDQDQGCIKQIDDQTSTDSSSSDSSNSDDSSSDTNSSADNSDNSNSSDSTDTSTDSSKTASSSSTTAATNASIQDALGIAGMTFEMEPTEVVNAYKLNDYSAITPSSGNSLVVVRVKGTNTTSNDISMNFLEKGYTYKFVLNGTETSDNMSQDGSTTAWLLNELSTYNGVVPAGESQEFVLLFQFNSEQASNLTDQRLEMTKDGQVINVSM